MSQRAVAGFSLLELSLSLSLGLLLLNLTITALISARHEWRHQQHAWQTLLSIKYVSAWLSQELHQASPHRCGDQLIVATLPEMLNKRQLSYYRCLDGKIRRIRVFERQGKLYYKVDSDKALQLVDGVTQFEGVVSDLPQHRALVQCRVTLEQELSWPITVVVRGS